MAQLEVREHFKVTVGLDDVLPDWGAGKFLCIHVRRGDYVNVASHLVSDEEFIALAGKFAGLLERVVVLSDSPLDEPFRVAMAALFPQASFLDQTDAETAHRIMRHASALICSNSQFSRIAAALNAKALAFIPKQWFGGQQGHRGTIACPLHLPNPRPLTGFEERISGAHPSGKQLAQFADFAAMAQLVQWTRLEEEPDIGAQSGVV